MLHAIKVLEGLQDLFNTVLACFLISATQMTFLHVSESPVRAILDLQIRRVQFIDSLVKHQQSLW